MSGFSFDDFFIFYLEFSISCQDSHLLILLSSTQVGNIGEEKAQARFAKKIIRFVIYAFCIQNVFLILRQEKNISTKGWPSAGRRVDTKKTYSRPK